MKRESNIVFITLAAIILAVLTFYLGITWGRDRASQEDYTTVGSDLDYESRVEDAYHRGYITGYEEGRKAKPPISACNINIEGKGGLATTNIYIESNTTDLNGFYDIWRYAYDPSDYFFDPEDFDTLVEIEDKCVHIGRKSPDSFSLIYTDWDVVSRYDYVYLVSQDDGDYSHPLHFK